MCSEFCNHFLYFFATAAAKSTHLTTDSAIQDGLNYCVLNETDSFVTGETAVAQELRRAPGLASVGQHVRRVTARPEADH